MSKSNLSSEAEAATKKFFSTAPQKKAIEAPYAKAEKKPFTFRAPVDSAKRWRLYADAAGLKVEELGTAALNEYCETHPLGEDQQKIFDIKANMKS